jgi:hypothetical protein
VLRICFVGIRYSGLRLVDIPSLSNDIPLTIEDLTKHIGKTNKKTSNCLREQWIKDCCEIIKSNKEDIEARVESEDLVCKTMVIFVS